MIVCQDKRTAVVTVINAQWSQKSSTNISEQVDKIKVATTARHGPSCDVTRHGLEESPTKLTKCRQWCRAGMPVTTTRLNDDTNMKVLCR